MFHDRFTKTKIAQYYFSLYRGMDDFTVMPFAEIRNTINTVRKAFNATVCAYNASFDTAHLLTTAQYFEYDQFFEDDVNYMDIWAMALSVLCNSRNYLRFCKKHDLTTAKGHPQTGAEAVYRYLTNDADFERFPADLRRCKQKTGQKPRFFNITCGITAGQSARALS